jgi:hypothetical protein
VVPRGDAVIGTVIKTGEDIVEVSALIRHQLPFAAEYPGNALHQRNNNGSTSGLAEV